MKQEKTRGEEKICCSTSPSAWEGKTYTVLSIGSGSRVGLEGEGKTGKSLSSWRTGEDVSARANTSTADERVHRTFLSPSQL